MRGLAVIVEAFAVIAAVALAVGWWRDRPWYRPRVVVPASLAIAAVGLYWTVTRLWPAV